MPLGGLLPYPDESSIEDDFDLPVVLDSGDLTDRMHQGADENMPEGMEGDESILALIRKLAQKKGQMLSGPAPGEPPVQMPELNGQVQNRMPQGAVGRPGGGLGRALLSGFRG